MKNYENVIFPANCNGIIDVTKPPYNLDNTGKEDCTEKLCDILDAFMQEYIDGLKVEYDYLVGKPEGTRFGPNSASRVQNGRIWILDWVQDRTLFPALYFPNGVYLLSDTVSYRMDNLKSYMYHYQSGGFECSNYLRFIGQSKEGTIFKLKDNCKGFEFGQQRPVVNFMNGERSNVSYSNYFENITIDVGAGNPGAIGLVFYANNSGAVRNVAIRSSDPENKGFCGVMVRNEVHSAANFYNLEITGFDYGIRVTTYRTISHFENITLNDQRIYGIMVDNNAVQFIGVKSHNNVPVLCLSCNSALCHVVFKDADLQSDGTCYAAIKREVGGQLFLHNVKAKGFACILEENWFEREVQGEYVEQFSTHPGYTFTDEKPKTLGLVVPPVPDLPWEQDLSKWCCVNDYGAVGDQTHDDTQAIQAAFNSGKKVIWFQPGRYFISKPIEIPATVEHVHFMYSEIYAPKEMCSQSDMAAFIINGESDRVLLMEKLCSWANTRGNWRFIRHDCKRTVFFRDCHSQDTAFYFNTVSGAELFFENVACTIGSMFECRHVPCFAFKGQTVWCHSINPERSLTQVVNDGGQVWWSGFKAEQDGTIIVTKNGGVSEVMGGVATVGHNSLVPLIINDKSTVSAIFSTTGYHEYSAYPIAVKEIMESSLPPAPTTKINIIKDSDCPQRCAPWYFMPLYSGRRK